MRSKPTILGRLFDWMFQVPPPSEGRKEVASRQMDGWYLHKNTSVGDVEMMRNGEKITVSEDGTVKDDKEKN